VRGSFAALAIRNYAILWVGSLGSFTAFFMSTVVQSIVAFELTGKNSAVGVVLLGQGLASAVLGPFGGAVADRISKRLINAVCQSVITIVFFSIGTLIALERIELFHLAAGSFVIGTMFAFMGPARQAWVVELVGPELRANAVALNQVALNAARIWAPALAGLMVAVAAIGAEGAYFAMGGLYAAVTLLLLLMPPSKPIPATADRSIFGDMIAGFRYVQHQPRLRWMLTMFFVMIVLGLSSMTVLPGLLENELGQDVEKIGIIQTVNAVGGLIASLLVASIAGSPKALKVYSGGALLTGAALVMTGLTPTFGFIFVPMLLTGIGTGAFQTLNGSVIVTEADPAYYGRVISLTSLAFSGFMLMGLPVGLAADRWGERPTLVALGVTVMLLVAVISPIIARAPSGARHEDEASDVVAGGGGAGG
jgi:predicted MFS family arabinose efflux permease